MSSTVFSDMGLQSDRDKVAHLLRRFAFGASESELDYYAKDGYAGVVDKLLNFDKIEEAIEPEISQFMTGDPPRLQIQGVLSWWTSKMLTTRRPIVQKMALFWHDHFATSAAKVNQPPLMLQHIDLLQRMALTSFHDLLLEVSKDPAMIFWLDNQFNVRGKPNENFAREIMELFTLGIGNYSEQDIQEAARAFTGWNFRRQAGRPAEPTNRRMAEFAFRPVQHDPGVKEILGNKGPFGGEDVVGILCGHPQTAKYLTTKLWEWFAYPNPEPALVEKLATKFRDSGLKVDLLIRDIMMSPEFTSSKALRAIYKNPVDFVVPTMRQLGIGEAMGQSLRVEGPNPRARALPLAAAIQTTRSMGMHLLFPPDVAGWEGGAAWITSATMVERIGWADRLFGVGAPSRGKVQLRFPAFPLFSEDPTPQGAVTRLLSIFDAPLAKEKVPNLVSAAEKASGGRLTAGNANAVAASVSRLIFGSPEFQFA
ncbi:MAG TPA: DUF1800 domain-containing protein [Fimbriimonadaceae bacterium]|nr:DUF1800 domain-containing protein [Fimbriimonadaceae bacterium]